MKNYCEIRGIPRKEIIYTTPRGTVIKVWPDTAYGDGVDSEIITSAQGSSPAGSKGRAKINQLPGLAEMIAAAKLEREKEFLARYPGIDELLDIIRLHAEAHEDFERMMESESRITCKAAPKMSIEAARRKYPVALAYLSILTFANSDPGSEIGYIWRRAGENAIERIEAGVDVISALTEAQKEIETKTESPEYREHVAGL
jgi:hypothetical protein